MFCVWYGLRSGIKQGIKEAEESTIKIGIYQLDKSIRFNDMFAMYCMCICVTEGKSFVGIRFDWGNSIVPLCRAALGLNLSLAYLVLISSGSMTNDYTHGAKHFHSLSSFHSPHFSTPLFLFQS